MRLKGCYMTPFNIKYIVTGRVDGRWMIQAFDSSDKPISASISCSSVKDTMRIWLMLNGYYTPKPIEDLEIENAEKVA
jgi:hypothetical protein